ncbi:N-acetylmuramoyl-L-alanine amidase [Virgibacillus sp. YIM 98842]|jgi:N-acetylmuramoyl-L-alanine amidase|uniref:N-acetylmuramoyl-L-alanine amidase n=1 Tax=Virgibacillus sp. YIM 98842 TaxID=2663533 RepID=UPI0013DD1E7E|nr:N-acetylmuramoyl-L-alanine amidase [Virgibacillus sp. YIM 98842]
MKHFKIAAVLTVILFSMFIFPAVLQADSGDTFIVGTDSMEMKTAPEQKSSSIGYLNRGDKITIFEEKNGWGKSYFNGEEIWVALYFLFPVEDEEMESNETKETKLSNPITFFDENGEEVTVSTEWKHVKDERLLSGSTEIANQDIGKSLSDYHFIIDAGHGGIDSGAVGLNEVKEKDLNLSTAKTIAEKLEDEGAAVSMTRKDDTFISLDERVHISNSSNANVFISIHYNANEDSAAKGLSTYYSSSVTKELAEIVQSSILERVNLEDRGAKQNGYHVLQHNNKPSILIELGFVTNPSDIKVIQTADYEEKAAEGLIDGLKEYFNE